VISIVVPTIDRREDSLARCIASYQQHTDDYEIIVVRNAPNCGVVWQWAAEHSTGDYIAFSADDLEAHEGWWQEAVVMIDQGALPAPVIYNADGSIQSCGGSWETLEPEHSITEFTRAPFLSRTQWDVIGPMIPVHYYTDNWISYRGKLHDIPTVVCHAFQLTHHREQQGRGAGLDENDRMAADYRLACMYANEEIPIPEGGDAWKPVQHETITKESGT
jgi:glycosyltransferase involved in cell wall biosynthesis